MKLEEKHKKYAIKCFARFIARTEVVDAFMEEFTDDLPKPPAMTEFPYNEEDYADYDLVESKLAKEGFITTQLAEYELRYEEIYEDDAIKKFKEDLETLRAQIEQLYDPKEDFARDKQKHVTNYQEEVRKHREKVKRDLSNQLRRLNITHSQFPEKYRNLFNQARKEYFSGYRSESLQNSDNVALELETLYGYAKQRIFNEENEKEVMKHITLAHQILKTIVAHNAVNARQEVVDITPQNMKALEDTQKALTEQLEKVTQQLAENTGTTNGSHNA